MEAPTYSVSSLPQCAAFWGRHNFLVAAKTNWMFWQNATMTLRQ
jgi:hypothetical protein